MSDMTLSPSASLLPSSISSTLSPTVRAEVGKLSATSQQMFIEEYNRNAKSAGMGLLLAFFACHYFYLGKAGMNLVFWITGCGLGVWWIVDLFRVSGMVRDHNRDIAMEALRNMKLISNN